jgi:hypothetical protein
MNCRIHAYLHTTSSFSKDKKGKKSDLDLLEGNHNRSQNREERGEKHLAEK